MSLLKFERSIFGHNNKNLLCSEIARAQLFEGQFVLKPGLNSTQVSFSYVQKHFL